MQTRSYGILQDPGECYKIVQDPKQNPIEESSTILGKMIYHLRQDRTNLVKKYTIAYLIRLMQREGLRKILWNPY